MGSRENVDAPITNAIVVDVLASLLAQLPTTTMVWDMQPTSTNNDNDDGGVGNHQPKIVHYSNSRASENHIISIIEQSIVPLPHQDYEDSESDWYFPNRPRHASYDWSVIEELVSLNIVSFVW